MRLIQAILLSLMVWVGRVDATNRYVATTGSNAAAGTIAAPWATLAYALCGGDYGCPEATENPTPLGSGDTLFVRGGTYHEHNLRVHGNGVTIINYPEETPIIDGDDVDKILVPGAFGGNTGLTVKGITFTNSYGSCVSISENGIVDGAIIDSCTFTNYRQSDNTGAVLLWPSAVNTIIRRCHIVGNGTSHGNYCGIQMFGVKGSVVVENCDISNVTSGIFYKHTSDGTVKAIVRNNYIHGNLGAGIWWSSDNGLIENNLIVNNGGFSTGGNGVLVWEAAGAAGGGYSKFNHNTVYGSRDPFNISAGGDESVGGDSGARYDTLLNNVLYAGTSTHQPLIIWEYWYNTSYLPMETTDYNCYYTTGATHIKEFYGTTYSFSLWRSTYPDRDANSETTRPVFKNTSGTMSTISDFEIVSGGGYLSGEGGTSMGCNVATVGVQSQSTAAVSHKISCRGSVK